MEPDGFTPPPNVSSSCIIKEEMGGEMYPPIDDQNYAGSWSYGGSMQMQKAMVMSDLEDSGPVVETNSPNEKINIKKMTRMIRNRESSAASRARKQEYVLSLEKKMHSLEQELNDYDYDALKNECDALKNECDALDYNYDALQNDYDALQNDYDALQNDYNELKKDHDALKKAKEKTEDT